MLRKPATASRWYPAEQPDTGLHYFLLMTLCAPVLLCTQPGADVCADPAEVEADVRRRVPGPRCAHRL